MKYIFIVTGTIANQSPRKKDTEIDRRQIRAYADINDARALRSALIAQSKIKTSWWSQYSEFNINGRSTEEAS